MISIPPTESLAPQCRRLADGRRLFCFPSSSTELVKIDFLTESGSAYQGAPLVSAAANRLATAAGAGLSAQQMAEFMDSRGIIVDNNSTVTQCSNTFYTLSRHTGDLLPLIGEVLHAPSFPEEELDVYRRERRQKIAASRHKSADMARRLYYEALFGSSHPLGMHAEPEDADRLGMEAVREHYARYHRMEDMTVVISGQVDDRLVEAVERCLGGSGAAAGCGTSVRERVATLAPTAGVATGGRHEMAIAEAVQTTIRMGRVLPLSWDDADYARLMILVTILGGYFGSRLMSNLREDKGYTYGVYARTQIYRGTIVFYIVADVAASVADKAEAEMVSELRRLADVPVGQEELDMVRTVLAGDFLRSVDGVFERSARFCDMLSTDIDERLTDNLRAALATTTAEELQRIAAAYLAPEEMVVCRAGAIGGN